MKQQEILKKIGNILKELNEQYEYLNAEDVHLNDLELELFAANAKFLTDHTEILRKINAQQQNVVLNLPAHTESAAGHASISDVTAPLPTPETEVSLPPLSVSAVAFTPETVSETFADTNPHTDEGVYTEPVNIQEQDQPVNEAAEVYHPFEEYTVPNNTEEAEQEPAPSIGWN